MNRTALALILAASLASPLAFAQQAPATTDAPPAAPAHAPNPHHQALRLAKTLNLTPDQTSQLEPILADRDTKLSAIRANTALAPMIAQKQIRDVQKSTRDRMDAILTPAQAEQLKSMQQSHAGKSQAQPLTPAPAA